MLQLIDAVHQHHSPGGSRYLYVLGIAAAVMLIFFAGCPYRTVKVNELVVGEGKYSIAKSNMDMHAAVTLHYISMFIAF